MKPLRRAALAALLAVAPLAPAGADVTSETIANHPVWVYTPSSTMAGGKRGLLVALHGCAQSNDQLWDAGNLKDTANARGLVVAVPGVGARPWPFGPGCWNFDGASDDARHVAEVIAMTRDLAARPGLNIDPAHVYVAGLSSGAAVSLLAACAAPDLFAGVGAIAGPSVGSNQFMATQGPLMPNNVVNATAKCRSLAGGKASSFETQIANLAYGDMDKYPGSRGFNYTTGDTSHPGQYAIVPTQWSHDNAEMWRAIYNAAAPGAPVPLPGGQGREWNATVNNKVRVTKIEVANVGHAWPAGKPPPAGKDAGVWIAPAGLDYPAYITGWFLKHNLRAGVQAAPAAPGQAAPQAAAGGWKCVDYQANNFEHVQAGRAYDWFGTAYAVGSHQMLGPDNVSLVTKLSQPEPGYYTASACK